MKSFWRQRSKGKKMISSYIRRVLQHNEQIMYSAQLHWIIYQGGILWTLAGAALGHFGPLLTGIFLGEKVEKYLDKPFFYLSVAIVAAGALQLINSFIRQISTELIITNQRVIAKHGLISTTSYELMMNKVEGATIDQTVMGRLLGYGTLMVKGTGGGISPIDHVAKPFLFHSYLMNSVNESHENDSAFHRHD